MPDRALLLSPLLMPHRINKLKNNKNMETKEKKSFLSRIPSWVLSIITAVLSFIFLFILAYTVGEVIAYISYDIVIVFACFFICRENPNSVWYVPIICNAMGIIAAIVEPNFWITALWMIICGGWVLSLIGAISGALMGRRATR